MLGCLAGFAWVSKSLISIILDQEYVRMNTISMSITPKAIQDLLDELEASKQSRLRAWSALQRLRMVLSEMGSVAIPPPAQKTFDAEGEVLENALRKSSVSGMMRSKVCVPQCAAFEMLPSRRNAKEIIRTLFRRCGKL